MTPKRETLDSNKAAAYIAYAMSDVRRLPDHTVFTDGGNLR